MRDTKHRPQAECPKRCIQEASTRFCRIFRIVAGLSTSPRLSTHARGHSTPVKHARAARLPSMSGMGRAWDGALAAAAG